MDEIQEAIKKLDELRIMAAKENQDEIENAAYDIQMILFEYMDNNNPNHNL